MDWKRLKCDMRAWLDVSLLWAQDWPLHGGIVRGESTLSPLSPIFAAQWTPLCCTATPTSPQMLYCIISQHTAASLCPFCVLPQRVSCVVFSSVPTRLLCFASTCLLCCVMHLFGLYVSVVRRSAPVVLLCSASTCLLSCPGLWQVTLPELSYHGCCSRPHPHQLNLFKFTNTYALQVGRLLQPRKRRLAMQKQSEG